MPVRTESNPDAAFVARRHGRGRRLAFVLAVLGWLQLVVGPVLQDCLNPVHEPGSGTVHASHTVSEHDQGTPSAERCVGVAASPEGSHSCPTGCNVMPGCSQALVITAASSIAPARTPNEIADQATRALTRSIAPDHPPPRA